MNQILEMIQDKIYLRDQLSRCHQLNRLIQKTRWICYHCKKYGVQTWILIENTRIICTKTTSTYSVIESNTQILLNFLPKHKQINNISK